MKPATPPENKFMKWSTVACIALAGLTILVMWLVVEMVAQYGPMDLP